MFVFSLILVFQKTRAQDTVLLNNVRQVLEQTEKGEDKIEIILEILDSLQLEDSETSIILANDAISIAEGLNDTTTIANCYYALGLMYDLTGNFQMALESDLKSYQFVSKQDTQSVTQTLNSIGNDYYELNQYSRAYEYLNASLEMASRSQDSMMIAISMFNLGGVFSDVGQYEKAINTVNNSEAISRKIDDSLGLAYCNHERAQVYLRKKDPNKAYAELKDGIKMARLVGDRHVISEILIQMAEAHILLGEYDSALYRINESKLIFNKHSNKVGLISVYTKKGEVYAKLKEFDKAELNYSRALDLAKDGKHIKELIKVHKLFSELYEETGAFEKAHACHKRFKFLEDSVFSNSRNEAFTETQLRYELAGKDNKIQVLNQIDQEQREKLQKSDLLRNVLVVILAFVTLMSVTLYRNSVKRKRMADTLLLQKEEIQQQSEEMERLMKIKDKFLTILSHDLRSPVNTLVGMLDIMDSGALSKEEVSSLSSSMKPRLKNVKMLLDNLLDWAVNQTHEIKIKKEEIRLKACVEDNLAFFKENNPKNINFVNSVDENSIVLGDPNMLDLVLRNLVANSVKFTDEGGEVKLYVEPSDGMLKVNVRDNGVGMTSKQLNNLFDVNTIMSTSGTANETGTGLGLKLCKEFIERMGGKIFVESEEGKGSTFKFTLERA